MLPKILTRAGGLPCNNCPIIYFDHHAKLFCYCFSYCVHACRKSQKFCWRWVPVIGSQTYLTPYKHISSHLCYRAKFGPSMSKTIENRLKYLTPRVIPFKVTKGHNRHESAIYGFRLVIPLSVWPHLFRGAAHEKRRGDQLKWSCHLGCTLEVFHVHGYQEQFIQPGWAEYFFLYLAYVYALCVFICAFWFVCKSPFLCFPEQLSHLPCSFWR